VHGEQAGAHAPALDPFSGPDPSHPWRRSRGRLQPGLESGRCASGRSAGRRDGEREDRHGEMPGTIEEPCPAQKGTQYSDGDLAVNR
jgi:hypothetical protein